MVMHGRIEGSGYCGPAFGYNPASPKTAAPIALLNIMVSRVVCRIESGLNKKNQKLE